MKVGEFENYLPKEFAISFTSVTVNYTCDDVIFAIQYEEVSQVLKNTSI